jgi:hypothetical protein
MKFEWNCCCVLFGHRLRHRRSRQFYGSGGLASAVCDVARIADTSAMTDLLGMYSAYKGAGEFSIATAMSLHADLRTLPEATFKEASEKIAQAFSSSCDRLEAVCDERGKARLQEMFQAGQTTQDIEATIKKEFQHTTPKSEKYRKSLQLLSFVATLKDAAIQQTASDLANHVADMARAWSIDADFLELLAPGTQAVFDKYIDDICDCAEVVAREFKEECANIETPMARCRLGLMSCFFCFTAAVTNKIRDSWATCSVEAYHGCRREMALARCDAYVR